MSTFMSQHVRVPMDARVALSTVESGETREILILPDGRTETAKGVIVVNRVAAENILTFFRQEKNEIPIDLDHSSEYARPGEPNPALGWIVALRYVPKRGIVGDVRWNPTTVPLIRGGSYQYLSPVVLFDPEDRTVFKIQSAAVTNFPAIRGAEKLAAATRVSSAEGESMTPEMMQQAMDIAAAIAKTVGVDAGSDIVGTLTAVRDALAKKANPDAAGDSKVAASVRKRLGLGADAGEPEVLLALATRENGGAASGELETLRQREVERAADEHVQRYVLAAKINPRDAEAMSAARVLARENPDRLDALMKNAKPMHATSKTAAPSGRTELILSAAREFRGDETLQRTTSVGTYVGLKLREAGLPALTPDEASKIAA